MLRAVCGLLCLCMVFAGLAGCGSNKSQQNAYRRVSATPLDSQQLSANSDYELSWDSEGNAVVLKSLSTGEYWSDILYDSFLEGSTSANGNSPLSITVADTKSLKWDTVTSYSQMEANGNIVCKKIENGIRVTYFFDTYKIAVPIEYKLNSDSLTVSVISSKILEDGADYKLVSVTLAPFLCSVKNDAENGSLFVPAGSGALMYTAESADGVRKYTGEVYGTDGARREPTNLADSAYIKLPVFGAYGGGKGMMAIIGEGAGAAEISAQAGNNRLGYSNIGATFYVRGYDDFIYTYHGQFKGITRRVNTNISAEPMSVTYYPLYGEQASLGGIAKKYSSYLESKNDLKVTNKVKGAYAVNILGGTNTTTSIFGIPKSKLVALTTFSQAESIITELGTDIGDMPVVQMSGYGDKGVRAGSIAGGKKYPSVYGSKKELSALLEKTKNTKLFFDYNVVEFSKSSGGFSLNFDVGKTAILHKAEHFYVDALRINDENNPYYTIKRDSLFKAAEYAMKKAENYGVENISFSDLGATAFSDFSNDKYINKRGIEKEVAKISSTAKKADYTVAFNGANVYAACVADVIFDTPASFGDYNAFDLQVPFYQMVFHSFVPMYSPAVNLEDNTPEAIARSIAYGMGLGFTLTHNYVENSDDLGIFKLYGTVYEDNKALIKETLIEKEYLKIYSAIENAKFVDYEINEEMVSKSTFDNGKVVYVNQSEKTVNSPVGELDPYEFRISEVG